MNFNKLKSVEDQVSSALSNIHDSKLILRTQTHIF